MDIRSLSETEVRQTLAQATGTTIATSTRGDLLTAYELQPVLFLRDVVDAAKAQHFFLPFCNEITLPAGVHQISIPKRTKYLGRDTAGAANEGVQFSTTEPTTSDITVTTIDNVSGVAAIPTPHYAGVAISNYNLRINAVNLLQFAKEELSYAIGDETDRKIVTVIGDATCAANNGTALGAQTLYGGDATTDATLTAGDVITTDLVAKSARYLKDTVQHYRDGTNGKSGTEAVASVTKNPWMPTAGEPFVLFISPAQEETFRKDSQFVNAAEYGTNEVIRNGEIGNYLGIKIVTSTNLEKLVGTGSAAGPDGTNVASTVQMTRCMLLKGKQAVSFVWGQKPQLNVFQYPQRDQTWVTLTSAFIPVVVHDDAVVFVDVTDV